MGSTIPCWSPKAPRAMSVLQDPGLLKNGTGQLPDINLTEGTEHRVDPSLFKIVRATKLSNLPSARTRGSFSLS